VADRFEGKTGRIPNTTEGDQAGTGTQQPSDRNASPVIVPAAINPADQS
jgi:hypothetical protein